MESEQKLQSADHTTTIVEEHDPVTPTSNTVTLLESADDKNLSRELPPGSYRPVPQLKSAEEQNLPREPPLYYDPASEHVIDNTVYPTLEMDEEEQEQMLKGHGKPGKDDTWNPKAENKIQINNASEESIREIPGLDQQSAQQILLFRKENGNVTPELLLLINSKLTKEDLERIDFARNNQKFTANQEKHLGKDDTTCGGSEKADTALEANEEDKHGTPLGGSEEGKDGTTLRGREEGKDRTALGGSEEGKDEKRSLFEATTAPKTVMDALVQRLDKFKNAEQQAKEEGNTSKSRRMGRITKYYQDAIKAVEAGKPVDFDELPTPLGYAPIPVATLSKPTPSPGPSPSHSASTLQPPAGRGQAKAQPGQRSPQPAKRSPQPQRQPEPAPAPVAQPRSDVGEKADYTFPKEDKDQNKNKIRINFADVKSIMIIPGLDQNWAEKILLFRTGHGQVTQELLSYIQPTLSKEEMAKIDFTPYTHQCTDYQEDHVKDKMSLECTAEDNLALYTPTRWVTAEDGWVIYLKNFDIEELTKDGKIPPYKTFLWTVDKLSRQTDELRDFCRIVSNNLKKTIPNAKIVYSARNPKNDDIAFVVLSTNPSDQKYIGGYPVKMKYAYGHCNEDFTIRNMERKEDLCFKSTEEEKEINAAVRSAHDLFSKWPNYSRTSFSFYKSSRFNEEHSKITPIEKGCIVLFVFLKHWIPIGWGSFPDHSRGYEIDVRQSLLVRKHTFAMPSDDAFIPRGTVQGSIKHVGNNKMFALTAAHVVFEDDEATRPRENLQVYTEDELRHVVLPIVGNSRPDLHCVSVTKAALGALDGLEGLWHVDAALLELSEPLPRQNIQFNWTEHGFTRQPTLTPSCFQPRRPAFNDIVIKYGRTTGITIGTVRGIDSSFSNKETGFFEIGPWQPGPGTSGLPFSQPGDSGSLVFVVNKGIIRSPPQGGSNLERSDLALVGMVNMGLDETLCYATHIDATMAALGIATRIDATMAALGIEYTFDM